jgi:hypothetical protein
MPKHSKNTRNHIVFASYQFKVAPNYATSNPGNLKYDGWRHDANTRQFTRAVANE